MVVGEGECMGKGGSFEGKGRKYKREKGRVWKRDEEFSVREKERLWEREGESMGGGGRVRMVVGKESVWDKVEF